MSVGYEYSTKVAGTTLFKALLLTTNSIYPLAERGRTKRVLRAFEVRAIE
jgi:hypothetical protein